MNSNILEQARTWVGTRYVHQGRVKRTREHLGGCDCVGLVLGVLLECDVRLKGCDVLQLDRVDYGRNPDGYLLEKVCEEYLQPVDAGDIRDGDIALMRFDKDPQHVGFLGRSIKGACLIHCYAQARGVVEHHYDALWQERTVGLYRI